MGDFQISAEALIPSIRSVSYRLREEYNKHEIGVNPEKVYWAILWLEAIVEWIERSDAQAIAWSWETFGAGPQVRVGQDERGYDRASESEPGGTRPAH